MFSTIDNEKVEYDTPNAAVATGADLLRRVRKNRLRSSPPVLELSANLSQGLSTAHSLSLPERSRSDHSVW